ncbi:MAG: hypothetical protein H6881_08325 [Rhodobiaceae bacterium]|nr:hypothetical protein [Rhodobiaceae bacterium]MCC0051869.1 hypothetical protein [Rhodobiaceae bacterium]
MAIIPTAWAEIDAFGRATGILSEPWEYVALRKMCVAYFAGMKSGEDVFSIPPMERDE